MKLPVVRLPVRSVRPGWKQGDDPDQYYVEEIVDCEVLTLNLNARTMRVRTPYKGCFANLDVPINSFLDKYEIKLKEE